MGDARTKREREPGEDTVSNKVFWPVAILLVALVIGGIVAITQYTQAADAELTDQLNDRYVERIELESGSSGNGGSRSRLRIDGTLRYDCGERDAVITCDREPQPTLEKG